MSDNLDRSIPSGTFDHYEVQWFYSTGSSVWFDGGTSNVTLKNATYSVPSNATKIKVTVKPVSKMYYSNGSETYHWIGTPVSKEHLISEFPPTKQSAPSVNIKKYLLTADLENISDAKAEDIEFEVYRDNILFNTGRTTVTLASASYSCNIVAGSKYRARCRAINYVSGIPVYGEWSDYSSEVIAEPGVPTNVKIIVESEKSIKVSWDKDITAESYTVEYTTNKTYFDSSSDVKSMNVINNYAIISGIEKGREWFFRVSSKNEQGTSGYSEIVSKIIGTKPEPPTTWTLTTSATIGQQISLFWVHNTEDGSKQTSAEIELLVAGNKEVITVDSSNEEIPDNEVNKIYTYSLDLTKYKDGTQVLWRIRTKGITNEYSDWSIQRTINVYAPPVIELHLNNDSDVMENYPFNISIDVGPKNQNAVTYNVNITAENSYITQDYKGSSMLVNAGDSVYSNVFVHSENTLSFDLYPQDIILENNQFYIVTATVAMSSGLTAEISSRFSVFWEESMYNPNAKVSIDREYLCSYITPFCLDEYLNIIEDVVLSVYRREFDGTFVEIANEIPNTRKISVTDPHPSLDYARYRIVARNIKTNTVGFTDLPGIPVNEPGIVIQWDEQWSNFDYSEDADLEIPVLTGSMLKLKYNVDISENAKSDSSMVKYIGRKHPVGYYGTHKGISQTWSCEVPKSDKETIYALRRLMNYSGDVYVRESSGNGFWANVKISMNIKHKDVVIPVSFSITRVEGSI